MPDGIPVKFIRLSANVMDSHFANFISKNIDQNCYQKMLKLQMLDLFKRRELNLKITKL